MVRILWTNLDGEIIYDEVLCEEDCIDETIAEQLQKWHLSAGETIRVIRKDCDNA